MGNSWVSLAGFMKMATNFISWKLDNQAAKEKLTEETKGLDSSIHALRFSGIKVDTIIAKLGLDRTHRVESIGFSDGICLGWKEFTNVELIRNHPQFILTHISSILQ
ncbi:hypothetical protein Gotri_006094 [Gossypium trilobum]|uniref:Uncharacterized protein n=1 Tax=Gossypium trilobum TaxID=34281 RepID=A0A7J9EYX9_9ROSI|nr:hypothetical protein [Gossypium trilobum]